MYAIATCAHCDAPIPSTAPRCVRCHTRYCDTNCQLAHWDDGHKKKCKKIARAGGAEKYYINEEHELAASEAELATSLNLQGARKACYICGKEGDVVRDCGCEWEEASKDKGYAHVACLVKQAERRECVNREGVRHWDMCGVCGGIHYGAVALALATACWKHHANAEMSATKVYAFKMLAEAFCGHSLHDEAAPLLEACLGDNLRDWFDESTIGDLFDLLGECFQELHRKEDLLATRSRKYAWHVARSGQNDEKTLSAAGTLAHEYINQSMFKEARNFVRIVLAFVPKTFETGETLKLRCAIAETYYKDGRFLKADAVLLDVNERVAKIFLDYPVDGYRDEMRKIVATQDRCDAGFAASRAIAVAECAADADGARCYLCLDNGSREGLVLGCGCSETKYVAHLSCMARFARRSVDVDDLPVGEAFSRWTLCPVCREGYTGHVSLAMAWQYLRTCSTLETRNSYLKAAKVALGHAQFLTGAVEEAKAELEDAEERLRLLEHDDYIDVKIPLARAREMLERCSESLRLRSWHRLALEPPSIRARVASFAGLPEFPSWL